MKANRKIIILAILLGAILFSFRFFMGLSMFSGEDELQIYLIGLKSSLTETYPFYGPDVVYTHSQIPGGLQGLLISGPLNLLDIPEAPYILLNVLTFSALIFFGWYLSKRIPNVPRWFMLLWLLTSPWTLNYSTHIENPSYVIVGAILFFIAIFELGGFYKSKIIHNNLSFFFLGFSIFWIMQLHLSWVLTLPYMLWVCWVHRKDIKLLLRGFVFFIIGALVSLSTLIPTLLNGFGSSDVENNVVFNFDNIFQIPTIIARFLMFASYEVARYIGPDTSSRLAFLTEHVWIIPIVLFLLLVGFFQVAYFIFSFFRKNELEEWSKVKWFTLASLFFLCFSFLFSVSEPRSHTFYILYPIAIWYSFYCYGNLFKRKIRVVTIVVIISGLLFHTSLFIDRFESRSLFAKRDIVTKAISEKDYTLLGLRRESSLMLSMRESLWSQSADSVFYADFEVDNIYFKPQNIVGNIKYKGDFSCKVDSMQPFSVSYFENLQVLDNPRKVKTSFWVNANKAEDFALVYEIIEDEEKIWNFREFAHLKSSADGWEFIELEFELPEYSPTGTELQIYFWMKTPSGAKLNVDNWELEFE